jgi:hypothetical protein
VGEGPPEPVGEGHVDGHQSFEWSDETVIELRICEAVEVPEALPSCGAILEDIQVVKWESLGYVAGT